MLKKTKNLIAKVLELVITAVLIMLVTLTFVNVITRNLFEHSILWAEELSRALFVWGIFLGISYAVLKSSLMSVTFITDKLKAHNQELLCHIIYWVTGIIFFGVMAVCGAEYSQIGANAISSMLNVRLSVIYSAIPYCGYSSVLFLVINIILYFQEKRGDRIKC